jgi:hypothetical protein
MSPIEVSKNTIWRACAGFAFSVALASCGTIGSDDESDLVPAEDSGDDQGLWTEVAAPPYAAAELGLTHNVLELKPEVSGDITLSAMLRWHDHVAGALKPQVRFGVLTPDGESTLMQIFESGGVLRTRVDLEMTDALAVGVWYRVVMTIADAPGRPVQVRIFGQDGAELWHSCSSAAACPSTLIDAEDLDSVRISVTVDDVRGGEAQVEVKDISLQRNP